MPTARVICLPTPSDRTDHQTRRELVRKVSDATAELLRERPYTDVTRRLIARQAGVSYLNVCAHFRSTEALIAEGCLDKLRQAPLVVEFDDSPQQRVVSQFRQLVELLADEPRYGAACVRAMMADDASLQTVRDAFDAEIHRRVRAALGSGAWPEVALTLQWAMLGAFANAALGEATLDQLTDRLWLLADALHPATATDESPPSTAGLAKRSRVWSRELLHRHAASRPAATCA
jgi:AcrR family transcriptional regulator